MIYVRIELWPHGDRAGARLLQELVIVNDGTGTEGYANYTGKLSHATTFRGDGFDNPVSPSSETVFKRGKVTSFPRRWSPSRLVAKMLQAMKEG